MRCHMGAVALAVLLCAELIAAGGDDPRLQIERLRKDAIKRAEPAVCCVLVSRSDRYARLFNAGPVSESNGRLGSFNLPNAQTKDVDILKLDLSTAVPESYGSGVVIDPKGLILTNNHVINGATKIFLRFPSGKGCYADIHAADPRSDLAVLRVIEDRSAKLLPLPAIKIGDASAMEKGDEVMSIAYPFAVGFRDGSPSASWGIVSNVRRRGSRAVNETDLNKRTLDHVGTLLQVDARLNNGCSGGALLDLNGELIGLTTAQAAISGSETPGGFALPLNAPMKRIVEQLRQGKEIEYGFLGVSGNQGPSLAGVTIIGVTPNSPAHHAGLQPGDRILKINDELVYELDDLFLHIGVALAGSEVKIEYQHGGFGPNLHTKARLAKFYVAGKMIASNRPPAPRGLRVDYASILAQRYRGLRVPSGVVVREVLPGSPADTARLQPDKVITQVNHRDIQTPADFYREMEANTGPVVLTIQSPEGRVDEVRVETK
jgi:serine protease Do